MGNQAKLQLFVVSLMAATSVSAASFAETITCKITKGASEKWRIPTGISFQLNQEDLSAQVRDEISAAVRPYGVFADIQEDNPNKIVLVWKVTGFPNTAKVSKGAAIRFETDYRAVFFRNNGSFVLHANSVGWRPGETGRGSCVEN